ncbi:ABC transporter permease [Corynebacterium imitans]|uniref:ABC transporter permease n=1 Tax=Corynebacterium imitans TaxID=156978 RepID=A0A076NQP7_9CORY|nr:FtsX-like permease family protein [Corynebacterium imitans]AIJ33222.1 ABC transporter permease [Corynebacterium imitans]SNV65204.1 ABC transporter permease [Corynebacterium imitans]
MYLAWREMLFARTRFLLMGAVLGLMSLLVVIISGLTAGLVNDGVSGLKALDADVIAFEDGTQTDSAFTRSIVETEKSAAFAALDQVEDAVPLGLTIVNAHNQNGTAVDLTLLGVEPDSFIAPEGLPEMAAQIKAASQSATPHDVIVSATLQDEGIAVGDTITIDRLDTPLNVVGFADGQRTFGHVDVAYLPLDVWQEIHAGARHSEPVNPEAYDETSVIVAKTTDTPDAAALSDASGLDVRTLKESFDSSPGYTAEMMTLTMIKWFLFVIAALVTGAFFLVWTIQRAGSIATLRAMGATKGFLLRDSIGQAVTILAISIVTGALIAVGLGSLLEQTAMPYATEFGSVIGGSVILFVAGLIGALVAVYRVTRTNPLAALGENR